MADTEHTFDVADLEDMERLSMSFGASALRLCREAQTAPHSDKPLLRIGLIASANVGKSTFVKGALRRICSEKGFRADRHVTRTEEMPHVASRARLAWANAVSDGERIQVRSYDRLELQKPETPACPERTMGGVDFIEHPMEAMLPELDCIIRIASTGRNSRRVTISLPQEVQDRATLTGAASEADSIHPAA